jgi:hypothetical protein
MQSGTKTEPNPSSMWTKSSIFWSIICWSFCIKAKYSRSEYFAALHVDRFAWRQNIQTLNIFHHHLLYFSSSICHSGSERICPSGGSTSRIWSRFGVGIRSLLWNRSVRNGGVLGESSMYFREASRRLSTRWEWDWHAPDVCWYLTARNMPQKFSFTHLCGSFLTFLWP